MEFGKGITAIVGPNGSGKSNIADGIRWVLGEQSARSLRGDTMQDVIFAGSDGKGPLGMASVSLTLGDCEGNLSLDFNEVMITRRVYRSGESQYMINKAPCRLRDIRDLFLDTGLGREGYWLISQGQIDAILLARPEERRLIIEEAAGIGKYRTRKTEATRKLVDTKAKLVRLDDIISELARQLEPLRTAAVKAKTYATLSQEYQAKGQAMCAHEWVKLSQAGQRVSDQESDLLVSMAVLEEERQLEENAIGALRQEIEELEHQRESLQELRTLSIQAMGETQRQHGLALERLKHTVGDSNRLADELREHTEKRCQLRSDLAAYLWRLRSRRRRLAAELATIEGLVQTQNERQAQRAALLTEMERIGAVQNSLRQMMSETQADLEAGHSRQALWQEQNTVLAHRLEEIARQQEAISANLLERQEALLGIAQELKAGRGSLDEYEQLQGELQSHWIRQEEIVRSWEGKLQIQNSRFKALSEMEKDYIGYYGGVRAVLQAREQLSGICGVVAELIRVPRELEIAVEIALGSSLQNIVTETDAGARQAVSYLKEKQAGRATFLPLDGLRTKLFPSRERVGLEQEGVLGIASELIEYEPKYRGIAEYLLGRVIVTKDLDTAVLLSRKLRGYSRIVTLEGDTVSPGGAITGGSLPQNDRSGLLQRHQQVARLAKAIQVSKTNLNKERKVAANLARELQNTDSQAKALAQKLHQIELQLKELEKEVALEENEEARWEREGTQVRAEIEALEQRLSSQAEEKRRQLERLEKLEEEAAIWQEKLLAMQAALAVLDEDQASTSQSYTASQVDVATLKSQIQADEREVARYRERLDQLRQAVTRIKEAQEAVGLEKNQLRQEAERLAQEVHKTEISLGEIEEKFLTYGRQRKEKQQQLLIAEKAYKARQQKTAELQQELAHVRGEHNRVALKQTRLIEIMQDFGLEPDRVADLPLPAGNIEEMRARLRTLRDQLQALGPVNTEAVTQYEVVKERYDYLQRQQQDLVEAGEQLTEVIEEMDSVSRARFRETITAVQKEFQDVFAKLFGGGSARLVLLAAEQLEEAGLEISVKPPGKKAQNINLLSGGERALTAISLLFALLKVKPSPFCVLDEIDASLDESNLERFTKLLQDFGQDTQFIVITHRPITMEVADTLYGVTMDRSNISQAVSVRLDEAAAGFEDTPSEV